MRGFRPTAEEYAARRVRVAAWAILPQSERQPPTRAAFAAELGITPQTLCAILRDPRTRAAKLDVGGSEAHNLVPRALSVLRRALDRGDVGAARAVLAVALGRGPAAGIGPRWDEGRAGRAGDGEAASGR